MNINELNVLNNYNFVESYSYDLNKWNCKKNSHLLGLKTVQGQNSLIQVDKKDINVKNLFLRLFNQGKLAHISLSLEKICSHLGNYDWSQIDENNPVQVGAFKKVCQIASRYYIYSPTYFFSRQQAPIELYKRISKIYTFNGFLFFMNSYTTGREILAQHAMQSQRDSRSYFFLHHYHTTQMFCSENQNNPQGPLNAIKTNEVINTEVKLRSITFHDKYHPEYDSNLNHFVAYANAPRRRPGHW